MGSLFWSHFVESRHQCWNHRIHTRSGLSSTCCQCAARSRRAWGTKRSVPLCVVFHDMFSPSGHLALYGFVFDDCGTRKRFSISRSAPVSPEKCSSFMSSTRFSVTRLHRLRPFCVRPQRIRDLRFRLQPCLRENQVGVFQFHHNDEPHQISRSLQRLSQLGLR